MKTAILVIDLQAGLFAETGEPFDFDATISRINSVTSAARKNETVVLFIQHEEERALTYGSKAWALIDSLTVESTDYMVRKTTPNAFLRTNLQDILEKEQVRKLVVCGYATEYCVDSTVRGGAALGYCIDVMADGHTTHDKEHASAEAIRKHHNATLSTMKSFGVPIRAVLADEIVDFLHTRG